MQIRVNKLLQGLCHSLAALSAAVAISAQAESPVWKVTKGDQTMYLGGTIHVLTSSDYPLPEVFDKAYQQSQSLVFEADTEGMNTPAFQQQLMMAVMNPGGEPWVEQLSEETRKALAAACEEMGLPVAMLNQFKPTFALLTLTMAEMQKQGLIGAGVEDYYTKQGKQDRKSIAELETIEQQIEMFGKDWGGSLDQQVAYTLKDLDNLGEQLAEMKDAWRTGDLDRLETLTLDPMKIFPEGYQTLLVDRNHDWIPKIEPMFKTPEVEFVMVGAAHLLGKDGLIELLKGKGYKVEPVVP